MGTLWRKTWRDLWLFKARTALVVLAIAVGTAAAGVAVTSLIVLRRDLRDGYRATNPAHAILDTSPFDPALAQRVAERPGVAAAEARRVDSARLLVAACEDPALSVRRTFWGASHVSYAAAGGEMQRTAESAMHRALSVRRTFWGASHVSYAAAGGAVQRTAESAMHRALSVRRTFWGASHVSYAAAGGAVQRTAESAMHRALSVRRTFWGASHVSYAAALGAVQRTAESAMHRASAMHQECTVETRQVVLWTLPDAPPTIGRLLPQNGAPVPPPPGTLLLERSAQAVLPIAVGDTVTLRLGDDDAFRLTVAGFVNDMAVPPTTVQPAVFAYIADATAARLGLGEQANQLFIRLGPLTPWRELSSLAPGPWPLEPTRAEVETTVTAVTDWLEHEDVVVARAGIPEPGVHLMQGNVDTGLLMVGILGGLTLLLSAFLVANVVGAVIAQQTAQIGVLKALGGRRGLVLRLYGRLVLIFGGLALLLAVPLGLVGAWFMSSTLAAQLNYDIPSFGLTAGTLLVQAAGALLVPLLAALGPVLAAARLPVRDALAGEKSSRKGAKEEKAQRKKRKNTTSSFSYFSSLRLGPFAPWRELSSPAPSPWPLAPRLGLRNVARRPARLALTVAALALAGALFMATFGLRLGLYEAIEILVGEFPSDVIIDLEQPQAVARLRRAADEVETEFLLRNSVSSRVELWGVADARRLYADGRAGSSFTLYGVPPTTQIAPFAERAGRWLGKDEGGRLRDDSSLSLPPSSLYINYEAEKLLGRPGVGDELALRLNGREDVAAHLVGISLRPFDALAYMPIADFERVTGERGRAGRVVVYLEEDAHAKAQRSEGAKEEQEVLSSLPLRLGPLAPLRERLSAAAVADELTARLEAAGIAVARTETADGQRAAYRAQFDTLVLLLMSLAGLTALVGGLGLGNTMALNVLERSREIGVLRALGARRPLLRRLVLAEGLLIALGSAALAVPLAVPLTLALDRVMGVSLLGSPLTFAFSAPAAVGWLALVLLIAVVACWLPAERAGRMTVREALAYE